MNDHPRPNFFKNFQSSQYQQIFPNQMPQPTFKNAPMETRLSNLERKVETFTESITQALTGIEKNQASLQANPISERRKGTLHSQPLPNPRNFR